MIDLKLAFEKFSGNYQRFEKVANKLNHRPDLNAFLLLDKLVPGADRDLVSSASHDEIWLDVDCELLAEVAIEDDIHTLVCCGVRYDDDSESLAMFV